MWLAITLSFLISLSPFKNQNPYPQSLLAAQILAKKVQLYSYQGNAFLNITTPVQKEMSTHFHVPYQHSAWHLCTICSHWELHHFSWLAVLFRGFSISGLSQCGTKKLFEWRVFAPDEFTWLKLWLLLQVPWLVKAWVRDTNPSCVILCPASVLFSDVIGFDSVSFSHTTADTKAISDLQHCRAAQTFSQWNFRGF